MIFRLSRDQRQEPMAARQVFLEAAFASWKLVQSKKETRSKKGLLFFLLSFPNFFFFTKGNFSTEYICFLAPKILKNKMAPDFKKVYFRDRISSFCFLNVRFKLVFSSLHLLTQILSSSNPQKLVCLLF